MEAVFVRCAQRDAGKQSIASAVAVRGRHSSRRTDRLRAGSDVAAVVELPSVGGVTHVAGQVRGWRSAPGPVAVVRRCGGDPADVERQ